MIHTHTHTQKAQGPPAAQRRQPMVDVPLPMELPGALPMPLVHRLPSQSPVLLPAFFLHDGLEREFGEDQASLAVKCPAHRAGVPANTIKNLIEKRRN